MANPISIVYPGLTGALSTFDFPFDYLSQDFVKVTLNGVAVTDFTFTGTYTIQVLPAPVGELRVYRETPVDELVVTYTDGSILIDDDLNASFWQSLHVTEEGADLRMTKDEAGNWDAVNLRMANVGDPVDDQDVATKKWAETSGTAQVSLATAQATAAAASAAAAASSASSASSSAATATAKATAASQSAADADADRITVAADRGFVAADRATVAADKATVAADKATVAADKATVAADKATTLTYRDEALAFRNAASAAQNEAEIARDEAEAAEASVDAKIVALSTMHGFRNKVINGNFDIWQRGTTSQTSTGYGSDDRWRNDHSGSSKIHSIQGFTRGQTDVPGEPQYFSRTQVNSVAGASNYVYKQQKIEDVRTLAGKTATLTFYAKTPSGSRNMAVELIQTFDSGSPDVTNIGLQKVALTTSWQKFSVVVSIPSIAGTLPSSGADCLKVNFWFDAGSSLNSRTDSLGQQSGVFDIARVSLVEGDATAEADPFSPRHIQQELMLCQRYYEKSSNLDMAPENGMPRHTQHVAVAYQTNGAKVTTIPYKVEKRTTPTVTLFNTTDGSAGKVAVYNGTWNVSTSQTIETGPSNTKGITLLVNYTPMTAAASYLTSFGWAADAEL